MTRCDFARAAAPTREASGWSRPWRTILLALPLAIAAATGGTGQAAAASEPAAARVLAVGDALPPLALRDQNDAEVRIDAGTRLLLLSRDMDGGGHVKEALAEDGSAMLTKAEAVYVADVSRMPGFVRSAFALPSMRRRPYPIALDETGTATPMLPHAEGKATVIVLDAGRITAISFASSSAEVRAALDR